MNIIASHISPQSSRINLLNVTNRVINYLYEPVTLPCWIHQFLLEHSARVGDHLGTPGATNKASDFYAGCIVQMSVLSNTINTSRNQKTVALPSNQARTSSFWTRGLEQPTTFIFKPLITSKGRNKQHSKLFEERNCHRSKVFVAKKLKNSKLLKLFSCRQMETFFAADINWGQKFSAFRPLSPSFR